MKLSKLPILLVLFTSILILGTCKSEEVFYKNENTDIEFRIVAETDDGFPWIYLPDQEGSPQKVSQEVIISTKDVDGATIEENEIVIHCLPDSFSNFPLVPTTT